MRRGAIISLLMVVAALIAPVSASASDVSSQWWVGPSLNAAYRHWHAWPTACSQINVVTMAPDGDTFGEVPVIGAQSQSDCLIEVVRTFFPVHREDYESFCDLTVHEFGHLLGKTHEDKDPIMRPYINIGSVKECESAPKVRARVRHV